MNTQNIPESKAPVTGETYKFMVMNTQYRTLKKLITGREVCEIAGLIPPENYKLDMKMKAGKYKEVALDDTVDLSEPGLEKFVYITRDQTEG